jgi:hypothetical protein
MTATSDTRGGDGVERSNTEIKKQGPMGIGAQQPRRIAMKLNRKSLAAFAMMAVFSLFIGCSGGGSSGGAISGSGGAGTLSLSLTDATTLAYSAVYVTIDRVEVHLGEDGDDPNGWETVAEPKTTYNLLELVNGVLAQLGLSDLEAGLYTQIRLIIGTEPDGEANILDELHPFANYIILAETDEIHELFVPSGIQTGIKLVEEFLINEGETTELILDFDASRSVVKAGMSGLWLLKPTIKVLHAGEVSSIEGYVVDEDENPLPGALVSAQASDLEADDPRDEVMFESSSRTDADGWFRMLVRPNRTYNVVAYKQTYDFDVKCGVHVGSFEREVFVEDFILTPPPDGYGDVKVSVIVTGGGDVIVSFRVPGCADMIEVASVKVGSGGEDLILPAGTYEVVAWSEEDDTKETIVLEEVVVQGGETTAVSIIM